MSDSESEWEEAAAGEHGQRDLAEASQTEAEDAARALGDDVAKKKKGRSSVRQRNNKRIQEIKDTARLRKRIEVRFTSQDFTDLLERFRLVPEPGAKDPKTGQETVASLQAEAAPGDEKLLRPPSLVVDGIVINSRWSKPKKAGGMEEGLWQGDLLDIQPLKLSVPENATPEEFQELVVQSMKERFASAREAGQQELVTLGIIVHVKLKVELFEVRLPEKRAEAPAIHSYAGPVQMKDLFKTIPRYVPEDKFLNLNAGEARCWVAKTTAQRGIVQTTHYQVGPDHCFQPRETITFRIHAEIWRFRTPVWVVAPSEQEAFQRLYEAGKCKEGFLVKDTLKSGDRFVLMPCFDRAATGRPDWRLIREKETVEDLTESCDTDGPSKHKTPGCGYITKKLVEYFALDKPDKEGRPKEVKVLTVDCHCLTIKLSVPAFIGAPRRQRDDVAVPSPPGLALQDVDHFMDLRGRLGFNAMGLLHRPEDNDLGTDDGAWIEVPLSNDSVMRPSSQLLFLDHWRNEQEQKSFRKVLEKIQEKDFLQKMPS